eukprot:s2083_g19.t1
MEAAATDRSSVSRRRSLAALLLVDARTGPLDWTPSWAWTPALVDVRLKSFPNLAKFSRSKRAVVQVASFWLRQAAAGRCKTQSRSKPSVAWFRRRPERIQMRLSTTSQALKTQ